MRLCQILLPTACLENIYRVSLGLYRSPSTMYLFGMIFQVDINVRSDMRTAPQRPVHPICSLAHSQIDRRDRTE